MYVKLPLLFSKRGHYDLRFWGENYVCVFFNISYFRTISAFHKTSKYSQTQTMNDDFTFLIFTYHNVFHSLLASFRLRKWRLLALVSSGCRRMLTWRACSPSRPRSQPSVAGLWSRPIFNPTPLPSGLNPAFGLKKQPSVFSTQHLGWKNNPAFFRVYKNNVFTNIQIKNISNKMAKVWRKRRCDRLKSTCRRSYLLRDVVAGLVYANSVQTNRLTDWQTNWHRSNREFELFQRDTFSLDQS